jgi:hypothetical protein
MNMGGTPLHTFELEIGTANIVDLLISYAQSGRVILRKRLEDCTLTGNRVSVRLTQEDTLRFSENHNVEIQLRVKLDTGIVIPSDPIIETVRGCVDTEVIL